MDLETIQTDKKGGDGKSKLLSIDPQRRKYIVELLHAFANRKISFASLVNLDRKKIRQVAEMGYVRLKHGRYDEAVRIFQTLTFIDHQNYFFHMALAGAYQKSRKFIDAIYQYGETLKLKPQCTNALVNRGEIYLIGKNYRKAAEDFREAILLDDTGKDRFANRARSLVIAIKRSLERDKAGKALGKRKKISPFSAVKSLK